MSQRRKAKGSTEIPEAFRKWELKVRTSKKEWMWQRFFVAHPLSESQWNRGHFSMKKWESERHKNWGSPAEGFMGHVATEGSLLGRAGKWRACDWAVVQLDHDEEMGPLHGMYGSMEAELEVQRTVKRAELTAFLCLLKIVIVPIKVHVDNQGIVDGLRRGERRHQTKSWRCRFVDQKGGKNCTVLTARDTTVEVEHVKAHRTKKEKKAMAHFDKFVTEGNEKADESAKARAILDEGFVAGSRRGVRSFAECGQLSLFDGGMERL